MSTLLSLLLIPIIIILILFFFLGIFIFSGLLGLWYKMRGRVQGNASSRRSNTGYESSWSFKTGKGKDAGNSYQKTAAKKSNCNTGEKKIFSKDEGEYVDFEMIE